MFSISKTFDDVKTIYFYFAADKKRGVEYSVARDAQNILLSFELRWLDFHAVVPHAALWRTGSFHIGPIFLPPDPSLMRSVSCSSNRLLLVDSGFRCCGQ